MPAVDTVGAVTNLLNKVLDIWAGFMKTKRVRYSIEGNKVAYEYMKRNKAVNGNEDKKLRQLEEKFIKLAILQ